MEGECSHRCSSPASHLHVPLYNVFPSFAAEKTCPEKKTETSKARPRSFTRTSTSDNNFMTTSKLQQFIKVHSASRTYFFTFSCGMHLYFSVKTSFEINNCCNVDISEVHSMAKIFRSALVCALSWATQRFLSLFKEL